MKINILTLFPEMFAGPFHASIIGRARERGLVQINLVNIRDFSPNRHHTVDDSPFGGGGGMVMGPEAVCAAVDHVRQQQVMHRSSPVVLLCPQGRRFTQDVARKYASLSELTLVCGHYEGIDERVREMAMDDELSLGDFVLTGGELAAMVVADAVVRLLPGALGKPGGAEDDSFAGGLLEYPQYTRPKVYQDREVPEILRSGNHGAIAAWRREESLLRTLVRRPDLLDTASLTQADLVFLERISRLIATLRH